MNLGDASWDSGSVCEEVNADMECEEELNTDVECEEEFNTDVECEEDYNTDIDNEEEVNSDVEMSNNSTHTDNESKVHYSQLTIITILH